MRAVLCYGGGVVLCRVGVGLCGVNVELSLLPHRGGGGGALTATATALGNNGGARYSDSVTHLPKPPLTKTTGHLFFHASLVSGRSA